jgi:hypothetical protein
MAVIVQYITAFTSQAAAIGVILFACRGISSKRVPKRTGDHLWLLGLFLILVSALVLGLSATGFYGRLMLPQWLLYMAMSTVGYRLSDSSHRSPRPTDGDSEIGLTPSRQLSLGLLLPWQPNFDTHRRPIDCFRPVLAALRLNQGAAWKGRPKYVGFTSLFHQSGTQP